MKKIIAICGILFLTVAAVYAAEQYNSENYGLRSQVAIGKFRGVYSALNANINVAKDRRGSYYKTFNEVLNYGIKSTSLFTDIPGGLAYDGTSGPEIRYTKLKDICSPIPAKPSEATACGKLIIDTNGFSNGDNKFISDTSTLLVKDRFVVYLYNNGVRAVADSIEETLIFMQNINFK